MNANELTRKQLLALTQEQQCLIDSLRKMVWLAARVDDSPPITEADFEQALGLPPEHQIPHLVAQFKASLGADEEDGSCSRVINTAPALHELKTLQRLAVQTRRMRRFARGMSEMIAALDGNPG